MGFDGTSKSSRAHGQSIRYWEATSPYLDALKAKVIDAASKRAVDFLDPLNYPGPDVLVDAASFVDDEVSTAEEKWLAHRRLYVGGSDCSAVLGKNHYKSNLDLYYDKIGANPIPKEETDGEDINLITAWGHMAEEYVGLWYHVQHPDEEVITDTNMYTMAGHPYIGGDVDGIIKMPDGHYALLEIKTTSFFNREAWANNAIPVPYEIQLRHYMAIMGLWEAVIVCMVDRDTFYVRHLVRDLDAEYALVKAVDSFWKDNVEKHHEPKPCGTPESIIKALRKYKLGNGVDKKIPNIKLGDEFYTKCVEYDTVDERYREVKAEADRLDNLRKEMTIPLIQAMGQAPSGGRLRGYGGGDLRAVPAGGASAGSEARRRYPDGDPRGAPPLRAEIRALRRAAAQRSEALRDRGHGVSGKAGGQLHAAAHQPGAAERAVHHDPVLLQDFD